MVDSLIQLINFIHSFKERDKQNFGINLGPWETAHPPLP